MKKVREKDLKELIENLYREFICEISQDEYNEKKKLGTGEARVNININSAYIQIWWYEKDVEYVESKVDAFEMILERISFGNLKMIFCCNDKMNKQKVICIYIANAYEIIE